VMPGWSLGTMANTWVSVPSSTPSKTVTSETLLRTGSYPPPVLRRRPRGSGRPPGPAAPTALECSGGAVGPVAAGGWVEVAGVVLGRGHGHLPG
jgi:hypothetical protein